MYTDTRTYGGIIEYIETGSRMVGRGIELVYNENRVLVGEDEKFWRWDGGDSLHNMNIPNAT